MDFSNFTFRCSSLGHIMTDPKEKSNKEKYEEAMKSFDEKSAKYEAANKSTKGAATLFEQLQKLNEKIKLLQAVKDVPNLSESCKTHLSDVYTSVKYNRREDIKSKYLEKGLLLEEDAITAYSVLTGEFHKKNKIRVANEWVEGELDFSTHDTVIDTKVNWSIFQFNRVIAKPIKPLYHWQLDGYMFLFNKEKGRLVYALLNTPEHLIAMEEKKLLYDFVGGEEDYKEACAELRRNHIYDDIPIEEKIRIFDVDRSEERIEKIKQRVLDCREYLNNITKVKAVDEFEEAEEAA